MLPATGRQHRGCIIPQTVTLRWGRVIFPKRPLYARKKKSRCTVKKGHSGPRLYDDALGNSKRFSTEDNKTHRLLCHLGRHVVPTPTELSLFLRLSSLRYHHYHHHHHHVAIIEVCHFLTRSSLIQPEVSSVVSPGSFCLLVCRFLLSCLVCYEAQHG